jgi:hypothetical protein
VSHFGRHGHLFKLSPYPCLIRTQNRFHMDVVSFILILWSKIQSAQMKLSGRKIVISSFLFVLSTCGFFCWIAMCLQMFLTKFHRPRRKTFVLAAFLSNRTESENISFNLPCVQSRCPLAKPSPERKKGLPLSSGRPRFLSRKSGASFRCLRQP